METDRSPQQAIYFMACRIRLCEKYDNLNISLLQMVLAL